MIASILTIVGLALFFGVLLGYAAIRYKVKGNPIVDKLDQVLPQTQCGQCTFAGCRPYAEAIAKGEANINQCPPGGESTIQAIADIMGVDPVPLNEEHGEHSDVPEVALIIEDQCIGCTLCIQACPVDAIIGAAKQMHTVIADECTGCELCIPPCPVDCIIMIPKKKEIKDWKWPSPGSIDTIPVVVEKRAAINERKKEAQV